MHTYISTNCLKGFSVFYLYIFSTNDPKGLSVIHVIEKYLVFFRTFLNNSDEHLPQDFSKVFYHPLHWLFCIPSPSSSLLK